MSTETKKIVGNVLFVANAHKIRNERLFLCVNALAVNACPEDILIFRAFIGYLIFFIVIARAVS